MMGIKENFKRGTLEMLILHLLRVRKCTAIS